MASLEHKLKINNSYESEPSSGSGSSSSEHHDYCHISDEENMNLPYLLKPSTYEEMAATTTAALSASRSSTNIKKDRIAAATVSGVKEREVRFGIPLHSSQESSFEGFGESPFDKLQRLLYPAETRLASGHLEQGVMHNKLEDSPARVVFARFYDTIVGENSCNAVDLQLSNEPPASHQRHQSGDSNGCVNANPSSFCLSFNGKINGLTGNLNSTTVTTTNPTTINDVVPLQSEEAGKAQRPPISPRTSLNTSHLIESFVLKKYSNERSPDLFGDDDDETKETDENDEGRQDEKRSPLLNGSVKENSASDSNITHSFHCPTESSFVVDERTSECSVVTRTMSDADSQSLFRENCRRECELLRRIRKCLAGVLPPPSVTIPQVDMFNAVLSRKREILNFLTESKDAAAFEENCEKRIVSLYRPTHTLTEAKEMPWRDVLGVRQHGLCYNLNKASESNEYLSLSVVERFIGAETATSYQNLPSSAKKRNSRLKLLTQSPGSRLSHLAKRRAVFSSANLATTSQKSSSLLGPQILIDKKKIKNRRKGTPKRMTPGSKKKNRKTPSSSARKRLFRCDLVKPGPSRETSKRALFQSPAKQFQQRPNVSKLPVAIKPEIANRVEKSKRALLFSPPKRHSTTSSCSYSALEGNSNSDLSSSQLDTLLKRKRDLLDDDDDDDDDCAGTELTVHSKLFRGNGTFEHLTPRALKIKSQSFCIGAGSSLASKDTAATVINTTTTTTAGRNTSSNSMESRGQLCGSSTNVNRIQRAHSDMVAPSNSLTENQKKKLLWAVSQALQEKKITAKHEGFKQYASILARVVKRIFQEYYQKGSTSNSETMLRLAKKYVYNVISGSTADDVYHQAKGHIEDVKRQSSCRLSGYIGPEEYQKRKQSQQQQTQTLTAQPSCKGSVQNIFSADCSIDASLAINVSQTSSGFCGSTNNNLTMSSQPSLVEHISQDMTMTQSSQHCSGKVRSASKYIQPNAMLQNSSSKSNLSGLVLRENVDGELRRSAQKNFTGKDQRNVSPYASNGSGSSAIKAQTQLISEFSLSGCAKAKRQITFDS